MNDSEFMKVGHTGRDIGKLRVIYEQEQMSWGGRKQTHQLQTIRPWVGPCVLHHVPVGHPLREDEETMRVCGHRNP